MKTTPLARAAACELCGAFLLVLLGCGAVHVATLTGDLVGLGQVAAVWGGTIAVAIYALGPTSGAHMNPAVTVGLWFWRRFPGTRVAAYVAAQCFGAFLAAAVLFALFQNQLAEKEFELGVQRGQPGSEVTASCYGEYFPNPGPLAQGGALDAAFRARHHAKTPVGTAMLAEFIGTAILGFVVVASSQPQGERGTVLAPLAIGMTVALLICVIAPLTQACFNPARDFGPRIFAYFAGWNEIALPGPRGWSSVLVYAVSPIAGAVVGMGICQLTVSPPRGDAPD